MKIELIGSIDYEKVKDVLGKEIADYEAIERIIGKIKDIELARHSEIVSAAGRLSRFPGDSVEIIKKSEGKDPETNNKFISNVIKMGHKSITDHDYLVFSIKDVSAIVEQMIIAERYSSFTIKSRREVDFSTAGFYIPEFYDKDNNLHNQNEIIKGIYEQHVRRLFNSYSQLKDNGVPIEDARYILPYCYHSNIIMGIDAHTLLDMIIKYTKTKYANITELREFGNKMYKIAEENVPYLIPLIDMIPEKYNDSVHDYLNQTTVKSNYKIINATKLLNSSNNIDDQILISAIIRRYQYDFKKAEEIYFAACNKHDNFKIDLMKKIAFESDKLEFSQVNFEFQIPTSYAILTHLTRHRTHRIVVSDFVPNIDLAQYKTPPKIKDSNLYNYNKCFEDNIACYNYLKSIGIREEDLIYFTLSGNMTNILTNMDGWTVSHILGLRECSKAQWETRDIAHQMHQEIETLDHAKIFSSVLGPTCQTMNICNEGKESCGRVRKLQNLN